MPARGTLPDLTKARGGMEVDRSALDATTEMVAVRAGRARADITFASSRTASAPSCVVVPWTEEAGPLAVARRVQQLRQGVRLDVRMPSEVGLNAAIARAAVVEGWFARWRTARIDAVRTLGSGPCGRRRGIQTLCRNVAARARSVSTTTGCPSGGNRATMRPHVGDAGGNATTKRIGCRKRGVREGHGQCGKQRDGFTQEGTSQVSSQSLSKHLCTFDVQRRLSADRTFGSHEG